MRTKYWLYVYDSQYSNRRLAVVIIVKSFCLGVKSFTACVTTTDTAYMENAEMLAAVILCYIALAFRAPV